MNFIREKKKGQTLISLKGSYIAEIQAYSIFKDTEKWHTVLPQRDIVFLHCTFSERKKVWEAGPPGDLAPDLTTWVRTLYDILKISQCGLIT